MRFMFYLGTVLGTILILGMSYSRPSANCSGKNDDHPMDSLIGIWKTTSPSSPIKLFYFKNDQPTIVIYRSIFDTDTTNHWAVSYTLTTSLGDCLFYYDSKNQSLKYLATYSDQDLTINTSSESFKFKKCKEENLTETERQSISNSQTDTLIIFQYRKPEVFEYYYCNDSSLRIKENLYYPIHEK